MSFVHKIAIRSAAADIRLSVIFVHLTQIQFYLALHKKMLKLSNLCYLVII
jgi:hypothetical protein